MMAIATKILRAQLQLINSFLKDDNLELARLAQAKIGDLMSDAHKNAVLYQPIVFKNFIGEWIAPKKTQKSDGVILYLHGGGYVAGDIDYARGFGTILAAKNGIKVFSAAYRLAPEYQYPAAIDDVEAAYEFLLEQGYPSKKIILCGESAGGGLVFALAMKLRDMGKPLPGGLVAISPWTDLTQSGISFTQNADVDPSMTKSRLDYFASLYVEKQRAKEPYASPLSGEADGLPPSVIFVGGDEVMLSDSLSMHNKLVAAGRRSRIYVAPKMWHAYILYGLKETKGDMDRIINFVGEILNERKKTSVDEA